MANILVLNSSVLGGNSASRGLVDEAVGCLIAVSQGATVARRDLGETPIPHLTSANVAGVRAEPSTDAEHAARKLSDELIAELKAADAIVIGAPMYNFSISTGLRSWFDHVLRPGETFSYSEAGPQGLLEDKKVFVIESRGGFFSEGPAQKMDFQEPYLRLLFGFMGVTDVTFIHAEKIGFGAEAREAALTAAKVRIATVTEGVFAEVV